MKKKYNFKDPFSAGQMLGMLMMLEFIEKNQGITNEMAQKLKFASADAIQEYFDKPAEDILLMVDDLVKEMK